MTELLTPDEIKQMRKHLTEQPPLRQPPVERPYWDVYRIVATLEMYQTNQADLLEACDEIERPEFVTEDHLYYLDLLRETGATNMFGAGVYIEQEYPELTREQASEVLGYWMKTFSQRHPQT